MRETVVRKEHVVVVVVKECRDVKHTYAPVAGCYLPTNIIKFKSRIKVDLDVYKWKQDKQQSPAKLNNVSRLSQSWREFQVESTCVTHVKWKSCLCVPNNFLTSNVRFSFSLMFKQSYVVLMKIYKYRRCLKRPPPLTLLFCNNGNG